MATKPPAEEAPSGETLKYQTWVLKVLIHCDGCTKRVKKLLQGIEGVYTTEIDSAQHKVTVTGSVDAETLIKKLSRSGKSVELWPEKPPEKKDNNKSGKSKSAAEDIINVKKEKEDEKINISTEPAIGEGNGVEEGDDECEDGGAGGNGGGGGGELGSKKKKKKKKKNKGAENGGGKDIINNTDPQNSTVNAPSPVPCKEVIINPPVQQPYPYPPQIYYSHPPPPPPPIQPPYGLSYNTSYPISSASNYYVGAPVMPMHAYANPYSRLPPPPPPPPSNPINHYYGHDEDEYQGGYSYCSIM